MSNKQMHYPRDFREALLRQVSRYDFDITDFHNPRDVEELADQWIGWWTCETPSFFAEIHDLENMPSFDPRHENALFDLKQHTVWNEDYGSSYLLNEDSRFNPRLYPDEQFEKFVNTALRHDMNGSSRRLAALLDPMFKAIGMAVVPSVRFGVEEGYRVVRVKDGVSNQGRAHSSNPAKLEYMGLYFRSQVEIDFFKALYAAGYLVAPLAVFLHKPTARRVEPDFVIVKYGLWAIIEIDGKAFHSESPVEAAKRVEPFTDESVHIIRFDDEELGSPAGIANAIKKTGEKFENWRKAR